MKVLVAGSTAIILSMLVGLPAMAQAPGTTRVTIKNPDVEKWGSRGTSIFSSGSGEFVCRPLACVGAAMVTVKISRSPTRKPDKAALAALAGRIPAAVARTNADIPSSGSSARRIDRLSSGTTTVRGYPAIVQELRVVGERGPAYLSKATMFVKSAVVNISSFAPSAGDARRHREIFTRAMIVEDTPL